MVRVRYWRLWAPLLVAGMMVVAFVPGREFDYRRGYWNRPRRHLDAARRAEQELTNRIAALEDRTRLLARAQSAPAVERGPLRVVYAPPATRADAEAWAEVIVGDIADVLHADAPVGRVVVYVTTWDSLVRLQTGVRRWGSYGALDSAPCLAFVEASESRLNAVRAGENPMVLGSCSWVLALGAPGPAVAGWLSGTRRWDPLGGGYGRDAVRGDRRRVERYETIGTTIRNCTDDADTAACVQLARRPTSLQLYWLLREQGREGLERFWRGGPTLEDAMRSASGMDLAQATRLWARGQYDISLFQTSLKPDHVTRAGLTVGLGLLVSVLVARRRKLT